MPVQHLLVVDDDPLWRERLGEAAQSEGCDVTLASDGLEALSCLGSTTRAQPDLVLLDLLMPRLDGWGLYGQMRTSEALRRIPILMMSQARGTDVDLVGVVGFLHKAPSPEPVVHQLREHLRRFEGSAHPPAPSGPYAVRFTEEASLTLSTLGPVLRHAAHAHLYRAAELAGTELPMMSTWLIALPGSTPSLLVTVQGVRMVVEVDEPARALTVTTVIIPTYLPRT
ncbi:MAG TPA: response regulator [Myxococcaceae bacterium]|nr:response regulator [Myxococcaceae bacterium]